MPRKIRIDSDPSRDRAHEAGAGVLFLQPAYGELGNIHIRHYRQWTLFWKKANNYFDELMDLYDQINRMEPADNGFRELYSDEYDELMFEFFAKGTDWIENTWLTFQHFSNEALGHNYLHPDNPKSTETEYKEKNDLDLQRKLEFILTEVMSRPDLRKHKGYDAIIGKIEQMRNAINHPDFWNSYNSSDWDKVPLAWLLSGQFKQRFNEVRKFAEELFPSWEKKKEELGRPGTIKITHRGVVSQRKPNVLKKQKNK